ISGITWGLCFPTRYRFLLIPFQTTKIFLNRVRYSSRMGGFMKWFQDTAPDGSSPLPAFTRTGITHLFFVCIHPLEDGNGRIGRAIAEKALAQSFGQPTLIALSHTIQKHKKAYYDALEHNNKGLEITDWLVYFSKTILQAQLRTQSLIDFVIEKT